MAETRLTHKLRNPKSYNDWINIWTSHFTDNNDVNVYNIYPSSNWKIPISQLTSDKVIEGQDGDQTISLGEANLPSDITIPVNQVTDASIDSDNNTKIILHNVTTSKPSSSSPYSENALTKFDENGNLVAGPTLSTTGTVNGFLNEKGNWITITNGAGIETTSSDNSFIIGHTFQHDFGKTDNDKPITQKTVGSSSDVSDGSTVIPIPYITYDTEGHIRDAGASSYTMQIKPSDIIQEDDNQHNIIGLPTYIKNYVKDTKNTRESNGVVKAGQGQFSNVWLTSTPTDNNSNEGTPTADHPQWGKVTAAHMSLAEGTISGNVLMNDSIPSNRLKTQLLGTWITTSDQKNTDGTFDDLNTEWDEDHCGIWIEI